MMSLCHIPASLLDFLSRCPHTPHMSKREYHKPRIAFTIRPQARDTASRIVERAMRLLLIRPHCRLNAPDWTTGVAQVNQNESGGLDLPDTEVTAVPGTSLCRTFHAMSGPPSLDQWLSRQTEVCPSLDHKVTKGTKRGYATTPTTPTRRPSGKT